MAHLLPSQFSLAGKWGSSEFENIIFLLNNFRLVIKTVYAWVMFQHFSGEVSLKISLKVLKNYSRKIMQTLKLCQSKTGQTFVEISFYFNQLPQLPKFITLESYTPRQNVWHGSKMSSRLAGSKFWPILANQSTLTCFHEAKHLFFEKKNS